eukprot:9721317-Alexandrium_andersonii.AAC.1
MCVATYLPRSFITSHDAPPKCNPQSVQGMSALQYASIRNPPRRNLKKASRVRRTWNCADPRAASKLVLEAPE